MNTTNAKAKVYAKKYSVFLFLSLLPSSVLIDFFAAPNKAAVFFNNLLIPCGIPNNAVKYLGLLIIILPKQKTVNLKRRSPKGILRD